jgi:hypothetical protein
VFAAALSIHARHAGLRASESGTHSAMSAQCDREAFVALRQIAAQAAIKKISANGCHAQFACI